MSEILLLSNASKNSAQVFPPLELLQHKTELFPVKLDAKINYTSYAMTIIDGRNDLSASRALSQALAAQSLSVPVMILIDEGGLAAISVNWGFDDIILDTASPAEVDTRIRLAVTRAALKSDAPADSEITVSGITINENSYSAKVDGRLLNLTYKEFELLKYLIQNPNHVFSREQLLDHVWGYAYYGGTRTVDVHIRRLRSKLGNDHENLINTIRNVGYRFKVSPKTAA